MANKHKPSTLSGRRTRAGHLYQDTICARWYAMLLHPKTTHVVSVQNEARGDVDDIRIEFDSGTTCVQQVKSRFGTRDKREIRENFVKHLRAFPGDQFEVVTQDEWAPLRELADYARQDAGNFDAFIDMLNKQLPLVASQSVRESVGDFLVSAPAGVQTGHRHDLHMLSPSGVRTEHQPSGGRDGSVRHD